MVCVVGCRAGGSVDSEGCVEGKETEGDWEGYRVVGATEEGWSMGDTEGREDDGDAVGALTEGDMGTEEKGRVEGAEVGVYDSVPHRKALSARDSKGGCTS
jgi:hypothetical protein